ncbi:MAG: hypothetical protein WAL90_11065 [Desulfobacterales bacterium]
MREQLDTLLYHADGFLIFFYRFTGDPFVNFIIGTLCLAFMCVLIGELTVSLALKLNKGYFDELAADMDHKEKLSIRAYELGDKAGYRALNKEATDAWGKRFFTMMGYSAGIFWPIPFVLGWMQTRFQDVRFDVAFPLSLIFGKTTGYLFIFIPLYILCRIAFKYLRPHLPYFRGVQKILDHPAKP